MKYSVAILYFLIITLLYACQPQKSEEWLLENEATIKNAFTDPQFQIINTDYLNNQLVNLKTYEKHLSQVNEEKLTETSKVIYSNLKKGTQSAITLLEKDSIYHWDATKYDLGIFLKKHFQNTHTTTDDLGAISNILEQSDTFYLAAKQNLTAIQIPKGKQAIEDNIALFHWLNDELAASLQSVELSADDKGKMLQNIKNTTLNIKDFIGFINSLINNADDKTYPTTIVKKN